MQKIIVSNLKMFFLKDEMEKYITKINNLKLDNINLIICPSYIYLPYLKVNNYFLGAQNVFYEENGAYTGEISASQLKELNVSYIIVGHQERRRYFNETNKEINLKIKTCLKEKIKIILCIGETKEEKKMKKTSIILKKQIIESLNGLSKEDLKNIVISYEPEYSIGTNKCLGLDEISDCVLYIKKIILNKYNVNIKVIYGGSVTLENAKDIINITDGLMIGKLSSNYDDFEKLLYEVN